MRVNESATTVNMHHHNMLRLTLGCLLVSLSLRSAEAPPVSSVCPLGSYLSPDTSTCLDCPRFRTETELQSLHFSELVRTAIIRACPAATETPASSSTPSSTSPTPPPPSSSAPAAKNASVELVMSNGVLAQTAAAVAITGILAVIFFIVAGVCVAIRLRKYYSAVPTESDTTFYPTNSEASNPNSRSIDRPLPQTPTAPTTSSTPARRGRRREPADTIGSLDDHSGSSARDNSLADRVTNRVTNGATNGVTNGATNGVTNGVTNRVTNGASVQNFPTTLEVDEPENQD